MKSYFGTAILQPAIKYARKKMQFNKGKKVTSTLYFSSAAVPRSGRSRSPAKRVRCEFEGARSRARGPRFACRLYYDRGSSINRIAARRAKSSRTRLNRSLYAPLSHGLVRPLVSDNACFASLRNRMRASRCRLSIVPSFHHACTHLKRAYMFAASDDGNDGLNKRQNKSISRYRM